MKNIAIIGSPLDCGKSQLGCLMGPDALRVAQIEKSLVDLGHKVIDLGDIRSDFKSPANHGDTWEQKISNCATWVKALATAAYEHSKDDQIPIFLGGDHLMSAGTVSGVAKRASEDGRKQFVLWLDAHPDYHTLQTTKSGNLHGTPVAYFTGRSGFETKFPDLTVPVHPENICMLGIRSVDEDEHAALRNVEIDIHDMKLIDETGIVKPLRVFLERVKSENGRLHVSLDVDFLDPSIAPAVGTTVPGGATFREAHLVMEILHEADLVTSVDIAELNPFLDERGRTAHLMVDLIASLMGRKVFDRPNRSH